MTQVRYRLCLALVLILMALFALAALVPARAAPTTARSLAFPAIPAPSPPDVQPGPRYAHTLTRVGERIYLFGGITATQELHATQPMGSVLNDLWEFNLDNNEWRESTPQGDIPESRFGHVATAISDTLFIHSGYNGLAHLSNQYIYDPASNTWRMDIPENQAPNARLGHGIITDDSDAPVIYGGASIGGIGGTYMEADVDRYNPTTQRWYALKKAESDDDELERQWMFMGKIGTRFLMFGGRLPDGSYAANDLWTFDLEKRAWEKFVIPGFAPSTARTFAATTTTTPLSPTARAEMAGVTYDVYGDRFLLLGGVDDSGAELDEVWEFDVRFGRWRELPPLPAPRRLAAAAVLEERAGQVDVLLFGGISHGEAISDTLIYTVDVPPVYDIYLPLAVRSL